MYRITSHIIIFKSILILILIKYSLARPDLILGSFIGVGGIRIQTYTLESPNPVARAILIHASRSHFAADFLLSVNTFKNINAGCKNPEILDIQHDQLKSSNVKNSDIKWKVIGELKLENATINLYEDGTNGWDIQKTYGYEDTFSQILIDNNITVHGIDLRSFGRSESPKIFMAGRVRGLVDSYDYMAQDIITFVEKIKNEYNDGLPLYLLGFSVGASVVSRALELYDGKLVDGIILISPVLRLLKGKKKKLINGTWWIISLASRLLPKKVIDSGDRTKRPNPIERIREKDPLSVYIGMQFRTGIELLKLINVLHKDSSKMHPDTSVLVFHSLTDFLCLYEGTERFYNSLTQVKKRRFVTLNNVDHYKAPFEISMQVARYTKDWILSGDSDYKLGFENTIRDN